MQSAHDFDDPLYQSDLDRLLDRLAARRRADRSRLADPLTRLVDGVFGNPFLRLAQEDEPTKQVEKPVPEELPAASTVEELRAHLGERKGTRSGRKVQPLAYEPTLDLELIESMFRRGSTLAQIRAHLRVGMQKLTLELLTHLPHIAEEAGSRRGRRPREIDIEQVRKMREEGAALHAIASQIKVEYARIVEVLDQHSPHLLRAKRISRDQVAQLRAQGFPQAKIAEALGCTEAAVYQHLVKIRAHERREVERLRAEGWSWRRIGEDMNACRKRLKRQYGQPSISS